MNLCIKTAEQSVSFDMEIHDDPQGQAVLFFLQRGGPPEPERVTEEVVREVEVVAHRLREWWTNERGRNGAKP